MQIVTSKTLNRTITFMFPSSEKNDEIGWAGDFEFRKSKNLVFVLDRRSDKDKKLVLITVFDANLTGRQTPLEITVFVWKSDVKYFL